MAAPARAWGGLLASRGPSGATDFDPRSRHDYSLFTCTKFPRHTEKLVHSLHNVHRLLAFFIVRRAVDDPVLFVVIGRLAFRLFQTLPEIPSVGPGQSASYRKTCPLTPQCSTPSRLLYRPQGGR